MIPKQDAVYLGARIWNGREREGGRGDSVPRHTRKARVPGDGERGEFQFHLLPHVKAEAGCIIGSEFSEITCTRM